MALAEMAMTTYRKTCIARDKMPHHWSYVSSVLPSCDSALEDEIFTLRQQMEQLFLTEQSLTSPLVVEISSKLDLKINEYMQKNKSR